MWVIEPSLNNTSLKYWYEILNPKGRIYKLNLTGKIHKASQAFLTINTGNMNFIREQAFKYWSGVSSENEFEYEILFEGFAEVVEELDPVLLGLE